MSNNPETSQNENSGFTKIALLLITGVFLLFPVISIISKLQKSIGNQPKMIASITIAMVALAGVLFIPIWKTRQGIRRDNTR